MTTRRKKTRVNSSPFLYFAETMRSLKKNSPYVVSLLVVILLSFTFGIECAAQSGENEKKVATERARNLDSKTSAKPDSITPSEPSPSPPSSKKQSPDQNAESDEERESKRNFAYQQNKKTVWTITLIMLFLIVPCIGITFVGGAIALWKRHMRLGIISLVASFVLAIIGIATPGLVNFTLVSAQEAGWVPSPQLPPAAITLEGENGVAYTVDLIEIREIDGQEYAVLRKISQDENTPVSTQDGELVVMKLVQRDNKSVFRVIEDDKEFEKVTKILDKK